MSERYESVDRRSVVEVESVWRAASAVVGDWGRERTREGKSGRRVSMDSIDGGIASGDRSG